MGDRDRDRYNRDRDRDRDRVYNRNVKRSTPAKSAEKKYRTAKNNKVLDARKPRQNKPAKVNKASCRKQVKKPLKSKVPSAKGARKSNVEDSSSSSEESESSSEEEDSSSESSAGKLC